VHPRDAAAGRLARLLELADALGATDEPAETRNRALAACARATGAVGCALAMRGAGEPAALVVEQRDPGGCALDVAGALLDEVAAAGVPRWPAAGDALAILPLTAGAASQGALALVLAGPGPLDDEERAFLLSCARLCAHALLAADQARLLREQAEQLEENRRRAESERERLLFDYRQAVALRDAFLSLASHELKTPLTALQLSVQSAARVVQQLCPDEAQRNAGVRLDLAQRQIRRLTALVDQLLDLSCIQEGRLSLQPREADLCQIVREAVERAEPEFARHDCALELRLPPSLPGVWDPFRVDQVVTNLISNALKYGAGQPVLVTVELRGERAFLLVADRGIGIPPEDQERIFERFERAVSPRHYSGFGLGLWIARQLVDALGGIIRLQSAPGAGSRFEVELPLQPGAAAVSAA
jgi:signal transduction histidine kinase